jgi:hypothetical protein
MAGRIAYYGGIVKDGLVLDLDAAKKDSYAGSGTVWNDLSGNNNSGSLINSPTFSTTNAGVLSFNGSNQYANCGNPLTFTDSFTISLFFKTTDSGLRLIMGMYAGSGADWWIGTPGFLRFSFGSPSKIDINSSTTVTDGMWRQGTCIYNKPLNSMFLYLNGILENSSASVPATVTQPGGNLVIGAFGSSLSFYWNGNISNVQIYNRALSATEIAQNYNALKSRFGL